MGNNLVILTELKMGIPQRPINNTPRKDSRKPSNSNNREECVLYPENNDTNMYLSLRTVHLPWNWLSRSRRWSSHSSKRQTVSLIRAPVILASPFAGPWFSVSLLINKIWCRWWNVTCKIRLQKDWSSVLYTLSYSVTL